MKIGLIQVDGELPNLALMKLSAWHKQRGDDITLMKGSVVSSRLIEFDKVYISCVFDENKDKAVALAKQFKNAELGGVGVNNNVLPYEIEHIKPDYDTFKCNYSVGFTTRGCIRKCYFCKVPKHEGMIRSNCDIYEFWDTRHKDIILMDNNILALPDHFFKIADQIIENDLRVDFNQGLDHRLLTPAICKKLLELRHVHDIRFAFDDIAYTPTVLAALKMLRDNGLKDWQTRWYLYIGEKDTVDTVLKRTEILRSAKQAIYVMRDKKVYNNQDYMAIAAWGNAVGAFKCATFEEVTATSERLYGYFKLLQKENDKSQQTLFTSNLNSLS